MNTETSFNALDLWSFSVKLYGGAGVKEACLSLQSGTGLDVCVLLSACWSAQIYAKPWKQSDVKTILTQSEAWRENVVLPLRNVRDYLKAFEAKSQLSPVNRGLRKSVLELELSAERQQLDMIERILSDKGRGSDLDDAQKADVAMQNLKYYLAAISLPDNIDMLAVQRDLQVLVEAAFGKTTES